MACLFKRSKPRTLGGMGLRLEVSRKTEKLAGDHRFYELRELTEFLSLREKLLVKDNLFEANDGKVDERATNEVMGLQGIFDEVCIISNTIGKRNCSGIPNFLFWEMSKVPFKHIPSSKICDIWRLK